MAAIWDSFPVVAIFTLTAPKFSEKHYTKMTQNQTEMVGLPPVKQRKVSTILKLALVACIAIFIAWFFSSDPFQKWLIGRRSTHELEQSVLQAPDSPWPFYELGVRYARQGRLPEAIRLFERARQTAGASSEIRLALGKAYIFSNRPKDAVPELQRATELDRANATAFRYLAMARRLAHDRPGAIEAAKRATELDPKNAEGWYQYGVLFSPEEGNENEGRPFLRRAVEINPGDGVYAFIYGRSLADATQFGDAIPYLRRAVQALPEDANTHFFLGLCLHRNGKSSADSMEAEKELRRAVQIAPNDYKAHFELGNVLEEETKFAAALPEFEIASQLNPSLAEIWFHLSRMADRAGQTDKAAVARAHFTEIRKYHVEFTTFVHQLQANPKDTSLQLRIGQVLEKQGKPAEAAAQYAAVLSQEPTNVKAQALLENLENRMHWKTIQRADSKEEAP